jgi:hypothetical protein
MKPWQLALLTCVASTAGGIAIAAMICVWLLYPNPWS